MTALEGRAGWARAPLGLVLILVGLLIALASCGRGETETQGEAVTSLGSRIEGPPTTSSSGVDQDAVIKIVREYMEMPGEAECIVDKLLSREDPELADFPTLDEVVDYDLPYSEQPDLHSQANLAGALCRVQADGIIADAIEAEARARGLPEELLECVVPQTFGPMQSAFLPALAAEIDETGELPGEFAERLPDAIAGCEDGTAAMTTSATDPTTSDGPGSTSTTAP